MRRIAIFISVCIVSVLANSELFAQAAVKGKVVDAQTGDPLSGAHVFLSGTKIGTVTNYRGNYTLREIPPGGHRLVVSMIGYGRDPITIQFGAEDRKRKNVELEPVVYEMGEVFVGNLDKKWEKHLKRFIQLFIGESARSDSVKIMNPEVLRFETRWWGRMTAEALAPLQIENRAMGYYVTFHLDEFIHNGKRTRWDGEPLFTEMSPANSQQAAYWEQNRQEAFLGSLRHFILALLDDRVEEEGFSMFLHREERTPYSHRNRFPVNPKKLLRDGEKEYLYHFNFRDRLEIVYKNDGEDERYIRWNPDLKRKPASTQTSYLELNQRPVTLDTDGEILEPYGATQHGYFAFERLADETPREYRPKSYEMTASKNKP